METEQSRRIGASGSTRPWYGRSPGSIPGCGTGTQRGDYGATLLGHELAPYRANTRVGSKGHAATIDATLREASEVRR